MGRNNFKLQNESGDSYVSGQPGRICWCGRWADAFREWGLASVSPEGVVSPFAIAGTSPSARVQRQAELMEHVAEWWPFLSVATSASEESNMSETKHTPGPWRVAPRSDYPEHADINVDAGTRGYVALCGKAGDEEAEANARLIAAAPELLDALRPLAAWPEDERRAHLSRGETEEAEYVGRLADAARAAIAKAEGR